MYSSLKAQLEEIQRVQTTMDAELEAMRKQLSLLQNHGSPAAVGASRAVPPPSGPRRGRVQASGGALMSYSAVVANEKAKAREPSQRLYRCGGKISTDGQDDLESCHRWCFNEEANIPRYGVILPKCVAANGFFSGQPGLQTRHRAIWTVQAELGVEICSDIFDDDWWVFLLPKAGAAWGRAVREQLDYAMDFLEWWAQYCWDLYNATTCGSPSFPLFNEMYEKWRTARWSDLPADDGPEKNAESATTVVEANDDAAPTEPEQQIRLETVNEVNLDVPNLPPNLRRGENFEGLISTEKVRKRKVLHKRFDLSDRTVTYLARKQSKGLRALKAKMRMRSSRNPSLLRSSVRSSQNLRKKFLSKCLRLRTRSLKTPPRVKWSHRSP